MRRLLTGICSALLLTACSTQQRVKTETAVANALISEEQENQLGDQVQQELQAQGVKYLNDPAVVSYVENIVNKLKPAAEKDKRVPWKVHVVDDLKTKTLLPLLRNNIHPHAHLMTDEASQYRILGPMFAQHGYTNHRAGQYVSPVDKYIHSNTWKFRLRRAVLQGRPW